MRVLDGIVLLALGTMPAGCGSRDSRAAEAPPAGVVDSALPRSEAIRRFRDGLPATDSLQGGAATRAELVAGFLRALERSDTAALVRMAITRREFAYLYYPTTPQALPPYELAPEILWFMLFERSNQGVRRALQIHGGRPARLLDHDCGRGSSREGVNTVWGPCVVRWRGENGETASARLFGQIIERGGRYKFLSYANKL